ncbi:MAG: kinase [Patescibacteria group bacterium]
MVITRTPFRISFFGGGTDYPAWFEEHGGAVVSTSIDKYCHVSARYLPPFFEHESRIAYSKVELVKTKEEIEHPVVREVLKFVGVKKGVEIHNFNDLPARSGIGSSSSFTVGILQALRALLGERPDKKELALQAIHVEQELLKENVGCQDQVAAAFGGLNKITFGGSEKINVEPLGLEPERQKAFESHLMLFFTGMSRNASEVAAEQVKNIPKKTMDLNRMFEMVEESIRILKGGDLDDFGRLLHETWKLKRGLSSQITNSSIDTIYEAGKKAGALGGKLLGAGGGGFMLFFVPPERQEQVKKELKGFLHIPFCFDNEGSRVIYRQT